MGPVLWIIAAALVAAIAVRVLRRRAQATGRRQDVRADCDSGNPVLLSSDTAGKGGTADRTDSNSSAEASDGGGAGAGDGGGGGGD